MGPGDAATIAWLVTAARCSSVRRRASAPTDLAQSWQEMSPQERGEAYRNYQRFQKLPPEQRQKVERNYDRWQQLPPQKKSACAPNYRQYRRDEAGTAPGSAASLRSLEAAALTAAVGSY